MAKSNEVEPMADDLLATEYIDHQHSSIVALAKDILQSASSKTQTDKAILIHDYVRDSILFGWNGSFWNEKASDVLKSRRGYCNTKSSLFAALLRVVDIPCRLEFVDINTHILDGLIDPRTDYETHTYTKVFNVDHNRWCQVDSYIVDRTLASNAKKKLIEENKVIGYGVHRDGQSEWNGIDDCFIQYVTDSPLNKTLDQPLSKHQYGHFKDMDAFYAATNEHGVEDRLNNWILRWIFPLIVIPANRATQQLRQK